MSSSTRAFSTEDAISTCSPSTRNNLQTISISAITVANRASEPAEIVLLPTLWFRNTWVWGCSHEGCSLKPRIWRDKAGWIQTEHEMLEPMYFFYDATDEFLFTENETNFQGLYGSENYSPFVKDSFHNYIVSDDKSSTNPGASRDQSLLLSIELSSRLGNPRRCISDSSLLPSGITNRRRIPSVFDARKRETDEFYEGLIGGLDEDRKSVARQAGAGLLWTKQFYQYIVKDWLDRRPVPALATVEPLVGKKP